MPVFRSVLLVISSFKRDESPVPSIFRVPALAEA